jgi:hypothetical protein
MLNRAPHVSYLSSASMHLVFIAKCSKRFLMFSFSPLWWKEPFGWKYKTFDFCYLSDDADCLWFWITSDIFLFFGWFSDSLYLIKFSWWFLTFLFNFLWVSNSSWWGIYWFINLNLASFSMFKFDADPSFNLNYS